MTPKQVEAFVNVGLVTSLLLMSVTYDFWLDFRCVPSS